MRLDKYLVEKKYFETRAKAQIEIKSGSVYINDKLITKSSFNINDEDKIEIKNIALKYVSRGGLKLEKALIKFNIDLKDKLMIDIGSSTGGFSDCAIKNGIKHIIAIDVGKNQFNKKLLETNKVTLMEKTDFRDVDNNILKECNIATIDISFISVTKIINKICGLNNLNEIILLIKPQFECGKSVANKYHGIVLDKSVHKNVIKKIINEFKKINFNIKGLASSPIRGGSGNIEYLAYFKKNVKDYNIDIERLVNETFKKYKVR